MTPQQLFEDIYHEKWMALRRKERMNTPGQRNNRTAHLVPMVEEYVSDNQGCSKTGVRNALAIEPDLLDRVILRSGNIVVGRKGKYTSLTIGGKK